MHFERRTSVSPGIWKIANVMNIGVQGKLSPVTSYQKFRGGVEVARRRRSEIDAVYEVLARGVGMQIRQRHRQTQLRRCTQ